MSPSSPLPREPELEAALAAAGWPDVLDRLIQGLGHDLNNRVQSLMSLVQLAQLDEDTSSLSPFLEKEVDHLEQVVRLMRLLPGHPEEQPELIHLPDILDSLVELSRVQRYLEAVDRRVTVAPEGLMPVRSRWSVLSRTLVLFLAAGAWEAELRDRRLEVTLDASPEGSPDSCRVRALAPGEPSGRPDPPRPAARVEGLDAMVGTLGGDLEVERSEGGARLVLRLPFVRAVSRP